jgi:hypothetical protein
MTTQAPAAPAAAPVPGTPEHDAAMAAKFDGTQPPAPAPSAPAPVEGLPEKFKSVADMAKAYAELEKKLGQAPAPKPEDKPATPPADDKSKLAIQQPADNPDADAAKKVVTDAGLNFEALNTEFAEKGELSPETYSALEAKGLPKAVVDSYIEGQKAIAARQVAEYDNAAFAQAGGEEKFREMTKWAATGLTAAEATAFNEAVDSGNVDKLRLAVSDLKSKFESAVGTQPTLLRGGAPASDGAYDSMAQVTADMRDPRYSKDPAFRAQVERKIQNSNKLFSVTERS